MSPLSTLRTGQGSGYGWIGSMSWPVWVFRLESWMLAGTLKEMLTTTDYTRLSRAHRASHPLVSLGESYPPLEQLSKCLLGAWHGAVISKDTDVSLPRHLYLLL